MPPKRHKITANRVLEAELIGHGLTRDAVLNMDRPTQSAEVERLRARAARRREAREAAAQPLEQENEEGSEAIPAAAPAAPAADEAVEPAAAAASTGQTGTIIDDDHPMDADDEAGDRLLQAAESTNDENQWLLTQPMEPPIAAQLADEPARPLPQLLAPLDDQARQQLDSMPYELQRSTLDDILNDQWRWLNTRQPWPISENPLGSIPADLHPVASQLAPHLQDMLARSSGALQREILESSRLTMYRILYRGWMIRTQLFERREQHRAQVIRQIVADPLLSLNPYVSQWLQGSSFALQQNYLAGDDLDRCMILQDHGMLIHIQDWGRTTPPAPVPEHLRIAEQIAMQQNNFTDYQAWLYSTARVDWIVWAGRHGMMNAPPS